MLSEFISVLSVTDIEAGYFSETSVYFGQTIGQNCLSMIEYMTKPNVNCLYVGHVLL